MGLKLPPIPDDYGVGNDCIACLPAGETPNFVFVRFWDIVPCGANPAPPNGWTFVCAQDPGQACRWFVELEFQGNRFQCHYYSNQWSPGGMVSSIQLNSPDTPAPLYYYEKKPPCAVDFDTNLNTCPPNAGTGGHAHVQVFVPRVIILLTSGYHFITTPNPLYEIQDVGMDHQLVHLAARYDKTNVLFYIDTQDLEFD